MQKFFILSFKMDSELKSIPKNSLVSTPRCKDCQETPFSASIGQGDRPTLTW